LSFKNLEFEPMLKMDEDNLPEQAYVDLKTYPSSVHHWGQLKLLCSEIQFLTPYKDIKYLCVVYAGSSPGHHLEILIDMMPQTWHWRLYDDLDCEVYYNKTNDSKIFYKQCFSSSRFKEVQIKSSCVVPVIRKHKKNVFVNKFKINSTEAKILSKLYITRVPSEEDPQLLFISDIRSRNTENEIKQDMITQRELVESLMPFQASLKFKLPYHAETKIEYLDGDIMLQCFTPPNSHECRLFTLKGQDMAKTRLYDATEFSKKCFNFQTCIRTSLYQHNIGPPNYIDHPSLMKYGVASDHCFDCTLCKEIIGHFIQDNEQVLSVLESMVKKLIEIHIRCKA
jgi:hypothetical protein